MPYPNAPDQLRKGICLGRYSATAKYDVEAGTRPLYMPNDEAAETADLLGIPADHLCRLDLPSGASRIGTLKCLMTADDLQWVIDGPRRRNCTTAIVLWQFLTPTGPLTEAWQMYLKSMKPLYVRMHQGATTAAQKDGIYIVEFVDERWFWNRNRYLRGLSNKDPADPLKDPFSEISSADGLTVVDKGSTGPGLGTYEDRVLEMWDLLQVSFPSSMQFDSASINADAAIPTGEFSLATQNGALLTWRNLVRDETMSIGMALDLLLVRAGYVFMPNVRVSSLPSEWVAQRVNTYSSNNYMRHLVAGGTGNFNIQTPAASEQAFLREWGGAEWNLNQMSSQAELHFPARSKECATYYNNVDETFCPTRGLNAYRQQTFSLTAVINSPKSLGSGSYPARIMSDGAVAPSAADPHIEANFAQLLLKANVIEDGLERKLRVPFGRRIYGGIHMVTTGMDRATQWTQVCRKYAGSWCWLTITNADWNDWLLGPLDNSSTDPKDMVLASGLVQAYRNEAGMLRIDAAPPVTRVFPARITGASRINATSGNAYWQWTYDFVEVEPKKLALLPLTVDQDDYGRHSATRGVPAKNLCENGNVYLGAGAAGNVIAPGVLQSDYPNATVEPAPICNDTVVMMCEQATNSALQDIPSVYGLEYWFAMPNAVITTCIGE